MKVPVHLLTFWVCVFVERGLDMALTTKKARRQRKLAIKFCKSLNLFFESYNFFYVSKQTLFHYDSILKIIEILIFI